jgi:hypothetical protein
LALRSRSRLSQNLAAAVELQSPANAREIEDYQVDLASVKVLELVIVPDIGGGNMYASLENLRLA